MPHPDPDHAVDVLYERKVASLNHVLLKLLAVVERDFLCRLEEARVGEAQLALERRWYCISTDLVGCKRKCKLRECESASPS
jgi:hypothetical protein